MDIEDGHQVIYSSLPQLRYHDFKAYHAANVDAVQPRKQLMEKYQLGESEAAARQIRKGIQSHPRKWIGRQQLINSLDVFSTPLPAGEIHLKQGLDGAWEPPEEILEAYRSRDKFARQVDLKRSQETGV